jgi:hypothetical protein
MPTEVNWADLKKVAEGAPGFKDLPDGPHDARIVSAAAGKTLGSPPKDKITITFEVSNGPHAGTRVTRDLVLTPDNPAAMSMFFKAMTVLGFDAGYFTANLSLEKLAAEIQAGHALLELTIQHRTWQDQSRVDVKSFKVRERRAGEGTAMAGQPPVPVVASGNGDHRLPVPPAPELPADLPF